MREFTGNIPAELYELTNLRTLKIIRVPKLEGSLSSNIAHLTNLDVLDLRNNDKIGGTLPSELGALKQVGNIIIYKNNFNGHIPKDIFNWTKCLHLSGLKLIGQVPSGINARNLKKLSLQDTCLTGIVPAEFYNIINLGTFFSFLM